MSLINNMLRDLDRRRASEDIRKSLPDDVRPLPEVPPASPIGRMIVLVIVALAAAGAAWWMTLSAAPLPVVAPPSKPLAQAVTSPVPAPAPAPVEQPVVAPVAVPAPAAAPIEPILPIAYRAAQADVRKADLATGVPVQEPEADSAAPKPEPVPAVPPAKKPAIAPVKETKPVAPVPKPEVPAKMGELRLDNRLLMPLAPPGLAHEPAAAKKPAPVVTERHTPDDDWRRAQQLIREGHPEQAEAVLRRAMQSQPGLVAPRQALLGILLSAKRHAEAADVLREGLVHSPEQTGWVMTLARLQAEKNDYPAAWETLSRSTAIAQQNADYQAFCGTVLQRLNRSSEAAGYYRNALKLKPREARWWVGYGIALEAEGKIAEARESYTRARSIGDMPPEVSAFVEQKLR